MIGDLWVVVENDMIFLHFPTSVEDNKSSYFKEKCSFFTAPQQVCCVECETLDGDLVMTSLPPVLGSPLTSFLFLYFIIFGS